MSLAPDLDWIPDLLLGQPGRFHNGFSHSPFAALVFAVPIGLLAAATGLASARRSIALAFACYGLHVVMDYFTVTRGVMLLWPMSSDRFSPPVHLFYGVRWSDGLFSPRHVWTILTEAVFVAALLFIFRHRNREAPASVAGKGLR